MNLTSRSTVRRGGSLVAVLGVIFSMFLVASPAQAAPIVNISASASQITVGESVTLTWTSADTVDLDAGGDWAGAKAVPNGSETVTPAAPGIYVYELLASNGEDPDAFDSVAVQVLPGPITPAPVTFPSPCTVSIPNTPNVTYFVDYGDGDTEELESGGYDGTEFSDGEEVTFFVEANDGFTLADGAVTEWDYSAPDECFEVDFGPSLVTTTITCGSVKFTNTTDGPLDVVVVSFDDFETVAEFTLAGGASRTVKTTASEGIFGVFVDFDEEEEPLQIRALTIPQNCDDSGADNGNGSDHPTVAPAAGIAAR